MKKLQTSPWIYEGEDVDWGVADLDFGGESWAK
jgi:hypothetical protein